eukprot:scaffold128911_cov15-Tisochrysis_lutea.AAC.1
MDCSAHWSPPPLSVHGVHAGSQTAGSYRRWWAAEASEGGLQAGFMVEAQGAGSHGEKLQEHVLWCTELGVTRAQSHDYCFVCIELARGEDEHSELLMRANYLPGATHKAASRRHNSQSSFMQAQLSTTYKRKQLHTGAACT